MTGAGAEFVKWLGQAVVVGFGWWVVHVLTTSRDRDKARREILVDSADGLGESLSALFLEARAYHLASRDVASELRIKMTLQDLAMRATGLSELCRDEAKLAPCRSDIATLRRAITGKHFEDEHLVGIKEADQQLQSIAEAVLRAKRSLLQLKHAQFPPR